MSRKKREGLKSQEMKKNGIQQKKGLGKEKKPRERPKEGGGEQKKQKEDSP